MVVFTYARRTIDSRISARRTQRSKPMVLETVRMGSVPGGAATGTVAGALGSVATPAIEVRLPRETTDACMAASSRTTWCASTGRSLGDLASRRSTSDSKAGGQPSTSSLGRIGSVSRWWKRKPSSDSLTNGSRPVSISKRTMPSE
jgi:hypothetical protein